MTLLFEPAEKVSSGHSPGHFFITHLYTDHAFFFTDSFPVNWGAEEKIAAHGAGYGIPAMGVCDRMEPGTGELVASPDQFPLTRPGV
jgi:hypothetical protein